MNTLFVRTQAQKVLFDEELKGQISDGRWENTRPEDHWIAWSECEVVVRPDLTGRDFAVVKDNYALTDKILLEVRAERMIELVRAASVTVNTSSAYSRKDLLEDLRELKKIMRVRLVDEPGQRVAPVTVVTPEIPTDFMMIGHMGVDLADAADRALDLEERQDESAPVQSDLDYVAEVKAAWDERFGHQVDCPPAPPANTVADGRGGWVESPVHGRFPSTREGIRAIEDAIARHPREHGCQPAWRLAPGEQVCPVRVALWSELHTVTLNWR